MPLPNFVIIGAAKSGTTAMYHALKQHPQIYMSPVQEPCFFIFDGFPPDFRGPGAQRFNREVVTDWKAYLTLFDQATDQIALGEGSSLYLHAFRPEGTAENMRRRIPQAHLVAILRHPADRAYSAYTFFRQMGYEPLPTFAQALADETRRIEQNWMMGRYREGGMYYANLQVYFQRFPREQIRVYLYEDWNRQPQVVLRDLFHFLGVDDTFLPDTSVRRNVTYLPRSRAMEAFLRQPHLLKAAVRQVVPRIWRERVSEAIRSLNSQGPPTPLEAEMRRQLIEGYREDILKLQDLIGQDLSHWLAP